MAASDHLSPTQFSGLAMNSPYLPNREPQYEGGSLFRKKTESVIQPPREARLGRPMNPGQG